MLTSRYRKVLHGFIACVADVVLVDLRDLEARLHTWKYQIQVDGRHAVKVFPALAPAEAPFRALCGQPGRRGLPALTYS